MQKINAVWVGSVSRCGAVVEEGAPEHFFRNPTQERTKIFLNQIL